MTRSLNEDIQREVKETVTALQAQLNKLEALKGDWDFEDMEFQRFVNVALAGVRETLRNIKDNTYSDMAGWMNALAVTNENDERLRAIDAMPKKNTATNTDGDAVTVEAGRMVCSNADIRNQEVISATVMDRFGFIERYEACRNNGDTEGMKHYLECIRVMEITLDEAGEKVEYQI